MDAKTGIAVGTLPYANKTLDRETIIDLAQEAGCTLSRGSIMPSDVDDFARDAQGHGLKSWKYNNPILLHRVSGGSYTVLPQESRVFFESTGRENNGPSLTKEQRLAAARKLLADNGE